MDHERAQQLFSAHRDGELDDEQARELEAHLEACTACRGEWEAFREALDLVRGLSEESAPTDFLERVQRKIRSRSKGAYFRVKAVRPFYFRLPYELFSLLMILVLAALVVLQSLVAVVRPVQEPAVRLERPRAGSLVPPGPGARKVLPLRREEIRYRYRFEGREEQLGPQILALAESFGAERQPGGESGALRLAIPGERFKDFTSKLLENLKFSVERERYFPERPAAAVQLEILFQAR